MKRWGSGVRGLGFWAFGSWLVACVLWLMLAPVALAQQGPSDIFARQTLTAEVNLSSFVTLAPKNAREPFSFDYVRADLLFYPRDEPAQRVYRLTTSPPAQNVNGILRFSWDSPAQSRIDYGIHSIITVQNEFPKVREKISFPLRTIPQEARAYLKTTEHIDLTPDILSRANTLAQGEDDLWVVVSKIAIWTKENIAYNLSTLTADVSQKASWVLKNRQGVCDELTSLFIAMLRSLGIPARFISGVSYTNSPLFAENWGAHGWAEVYFPGHGWIPFDPTFGEFGWIDPGHVKMLESADPAEPSTLFEWRGKNAELGVRELDIGAAIKDLGSRIVPHVRLSVAPVYDEAGFGSHNLVLGEIENLNDYYTTLMISLARVRELDVIDDYDQEIILRPFEKKRLLWRVRVQDNLQKEYVYTLPLGISTIWNETALSSFQALAKGEQHSRQDVTRTMNALAEEEEKVLTTTLDLDCSAQPQGIFAGEQAVITCALHNRGTVALPDLRACLEANCQPVPLGIGQRASVEFVQEYTSAGTKSIAVSAQAQGVSRTSVLALRMLDTPAVAFQDVRAPASAQWGETVSVQFVLEPVSLATPKNVVISVGRDGRLRDVFTVDDLTSAQPFAIDLSGKDFAGAEKIVLEARFVDDQGKAYVERAGIPVTITRVPWYWRPFVWLRNLFG